MNTLLRCATMLGLVAILAGCQTTPPANQGTTGRRMDPSHDSPAELGNQGLRSADLVAATDKMAQEIAQRLDVVDLDNPPRIFVGEIENKTSMPYRDYQVFLARLRSTLNSSATRHGLVFVRERAYIEQQRSREYGNVTPGSAPGDYRSSADYVLTAEIYDLPSGLTNYFLVDFQLVQLRDAVSGSDMGGGVIVWENSYEVKFQ